LTSAIRTCALLLAGLAGMPASTAASAESPATVVTSPQPLPAPDGRVRIFLAGSIDMGGSEDWQARAIERLSGPDTVLFNPRRPDWNPAWKPEASEPEFRRQVEWELEALEQSDLVLMYLVPGSQSPVSLLEFGLHAREGKLHVAAPAGFWRKGNVEVTADRYGIPRHETLDELLDAIEAEVAARRAAVSPVPGRTPP